MIARWITRWEHWWFRETDPHLLAVFRILFGGFLFFYFALQIPYVGMLYSRDGLLLPMFAPTGPFTAIFAAPPPWAANVLFFSFLAALLSFTAGFFTRVSAITALVLYSYYWFLSLFLLGASFDHIFLFFLLVLGCSGCGKTFSADMRIRHGSFFASEPISILPQRILAVQIAMTYFGVGWQKLFLPDWQDGKILAYSFIGRWGTPPAYVLARLNIPLSWYDATVHLIKIFECSIPFGLWFRRTRLWYIAMGSAFHTGIAVLLAIWWFLALLPSYILFFEPEEIALLLTRKCGTLPRVCRCPETSTTRSALSITSSSTSLPSARHSAAAAWKKVRMHSTRQPRKSS